MPLDADRLQALERQIMELEQIDAELLMAQELIEHPATDPIAWLDGARKRLRRLIAALTPPPAEGPPMTDDQIAAMMRDPKYIRQTQIAAMMDLARRNFYPNGRRGENLYCEECDDYLPHDHTHPAAAGERRA